MWLHSMTFLSAVGVVATTKAIVFDGLVEEVASIGLLPITAQHISVVVNEATFTVSLIEGR
jgi:hypothetical protein